MRNGDSESGKPKLCSDYFRQPIEESESTMSRRKPTPDYGEQVEDLIFQAADLPEGAAKVAIFEEAVALADLHQDVPLAYETRMEMLWPAYHASRQDLLLVHFAWCLAKLDADDDLDAHDALWAYRWVLDTMPGFPDIPRAQIESAIADMMARYEHHGASLRPCYLLHRRVYRGLGDRDAAVAAHKKIAKAKRDWLCDDLETEKAFAVFFAIFSEKYAEGVKLGEKWLAEPFVSDHFRGLILTDLLLPLCRVGRWDDAAAFQKLSLPMLKKERQSSGNFALHAEYLALVGQFAPAVKAFEGHLLEAGTEPNRITRFDYFRAGKFLCARLDAAGKTKIKFRVPDSLKIPGAEAGRIHSDLLAEWLDGQLTDLVHRIDTRNGTPYFAGELAKVEELISLSEKYRKSKAKKAP